MGRFAEWLFGPPIEGPVTASAAEPVTAAPPARQVAAALGRDTAPAAPQGVWRLWREVGEARYATTQQARITSRLAWRVEIEGEPADPDEVEQTLDLTFAGMLRELVKLMSLHLQVAGGGILARTEPDDPTSWEVMSHKPAGKQFKRLQNADIALRFTNPDPEDPSRMDSPIIGAKGVLEDLLLARAQSRTESRARTSQSRALLYPIDGVRDREAFEDSLVDVITAPLSGETSAAAVVPNLIGFQSDLIKDWRVVDLGLPPDAALAAKIDALIRQLAVILDIPAELLTGMGESNHWSAWAVQEDNWLSHIEPMSLPIADTIERVLRTLSGDDRLQVTADPAPLLVRRPALDDAIRAYQLGVVSDEWLREQLGAHDEDAGDGVIKANPRAEGRAPASSEPTAAAASAPLGVLLTQIDQRTGDGVETWLRAAVEAILTELGRRVEAELRERGEDVPAVPLSALPARYPHLVTGVDALVEAACSEDEPVAAGPLGVGVRRLLKGAASEVAKHVTGFRESPVTPVLVGVVGGIVAAAVAGRAYEALTHYGRDAVMAAAGGGFTPQDRPSSTAGNAMAVGQTSLALLQSRGVTATEWRWQHYAGAQKDPHPQHLAFDGETYDGRAIYLDGVTWFPGDHAGCRCAAVPTLES